MKESSKYLLCDPAQCDIHIFTFMLNKNKSNDIMVKKFLKGLEDRTPVKLLMKVI